MKSLQIQDNGSGICVGAAFLAVAGFKPHLHRKQIYPFWQNASLHPNCLLSRTCYVSQPTGFGEKHSRLSLMWHNSLLSLRRRAILAHGSMSEPYSAVSFLSDSNFRAFYLDGALVDSKTREKSEPRPCAGNDGTTITVKYRRR